MITQKEIVHGKIRIHPILILFLLAGTADVEMWILPGQCLGMQFHIDLDKEIVMEKIYSALVACGRLDAEEAVLSENSLRNTVPRPEKVKAMCR